MAIKAMYTASEEQALNKLVNRATYMYQFLLGTKTTKRETNQISCVVWDI